MHAYISLLRGVNVGGTSLSMKSLVELYDSMGLKDAQSYIQSGNVLFNASEKDVSRISFGIEAEIARRFKMHVKVIIRTQHELKKVLASNPFAEWQKTYVTFLAVKPAPELIASLTSSKTTTDEFRVLGREIYLYCPGGYGKTVWSNAFFEKKLHLNATTRNWKTLTALYEVSTST
jgi:uncharacterized protein (DUF1697 family)